MCVFTPDTQENCNLVCNFVNEKQPVDLTLKYIQFDPKSYEFDHLKNLKNLTLKHISNVNISSLLSQLKNLSELKLEEIDINTDKMDALI